MELDKETLNRLTDQTNRSNPQTQFLYELVGFDLEKLKQLEVQLKNCFVNYCPASLDEVNKVMNLKPKSNYFSLNK